MKLNLRGDKADEERVEMDNGEPTEVGFYPEGTGGKEHQKFEEGK